MFGLDWLTIVTILFALSEALSLIPGIKANGIFQAIFNGLKFIKDALTPKAPPAGE